MLELSRPAARALALAAQGLAAPPAAPATPAAIRAAIRRMGLLQIDSIHVVARSPYFVLWSRLGAYDPAWLDTLLAEGALFEYWAHAACFLPIEDYPLYRRIMLWGQDGGLMSATPNARRRAWLAAHQAEVDLILDRIRTGGPVRAADFPRADGRRGTWWDWKPEKEVLERLFYAGVLMVARREHFQRVYDLRERVLPDWDDARLPDAEEARRAFALMAVRALGVARAAWVSTYFYTARRGTAELLEQLAGEGRIARVRVAGWEEPAYVHPDHAATAEAAAAGTLVPRHTTFLSPFDPLVSDRDRAEDLFGFHYRIEVYTPAAQRRYGYYTLPILHRDAIVGRLDAKAHRRDQRFEVRALHLEPGVAPDPPLLAALAAALIACAAWHQTPHVEITATDPPEAAAGLRAALAARA